MLLLKTVKEAGKIVGVKFCSFNCSDDDNERGAVTVHNALVCYICSIGHVVGAEFVTFIT